MTLAGADGPAGLLPGVTVVIPTHQGRDRLGACLESLAAQTLAAERFEVVVVLNGPSDGSAEVVEELRAKHPELTLRVVELPYAGASRARNAGIAAARRAYLTFVDDDDHISPAFLEVLLEHAGPRVVPMAALIDVGPDGTDADNHVNRMLTENAGRLVSPADLRVATTVNAAKLVATALVKDLAYDPDLDSGEDIVFWMTLVVREPLQFYVCRADEGATYYRTVRAGSVSRAAKSFDFNVRQRLAVIGRLEQLHDEAGPRERELLQSRIRGQAAFVNEYLLDHPGDHGRVVELLDTQGITQLPYDRMNRLLAKGLVIAYAFPPYVDTSGIVMAKRVRERGDVVDVISNAMDRIRSTDSGLRRISGPFVGYDKALTTPSYFADWGSMERFVVAGLDVIRSWEGKGKYAFVYSRAHFAASHFLAAAYKLANPEARWIAEFSDPLSRDVHGEERGSQVRKGRLSHDLRRGLRSRGLPVPASKNGFVWCEEVAYALADEIVFTNVNQRDYMLSYCSDAGLAARVREKAVIAPHPTLPPLFYELETLPYALPDGLVHLAYFGNFYATRGLDEILQAIAAVEPEASARLRLHVFTSKPDDLRERSAELGIADRVQVGPYAGFLEFLNLTTRFDCLIVNDAVTGDTHTANPYLPSKWSDYRGSGTPVWGVVEEGSPLSRQPVAYRSVVGDVDAAVAVLRQLVDAAGDQRVSRSSRAGGSETRA
ncbi:MAG: glycosyltransferase [Hamadaea sp.]|nr:glycosyltransferase [Hamadaea sp.]